MTMIRKLILGGILAFFAIAIPVSIWAAIKYGGTTTRPIKMHQPFEEAKGMATYLKNLNWNDHATIANNIKEKKTFVVYFGNEKCSKCEKVRKQIINDWKENSNNLNDVFKKAKEKNHNQQFFYTFYGNATSIAKPIENLKKAIGKNKIKPDLLEETFKDPELFKNEQTIGEIAGTPVILFFKEGQLVGQKTGYAKNISKALQAGLKNIFNLS